jgi:hypothetical protein
MVPKANDYKALVAEVTCDAAISASISLKLRTPVLAVVLRPAAMLRTPMPETAVRESDETQPGQQVIGFTDKTFRVNDNLMPGKHKAEKFAEPSLGTRPFRTNARHVETALLFRKPIRHTYKRLRVRGMVRRRLRHHFLRVFPCYTREREECVLQPRLQQEEETRSPPADRRRSWIL